MLTILSLTKGNCMWCLEETDVVQATFEDGLSGPLCRKHLWQALQVRAEVQPPEPKIEPRPTANPRP